MASFYDLTTGSYPVVGRGGTKTVYGINDSIVVFRPNKQDGQILVDNWHRIISEENQMANLLKKIGILTLNFILCEIKHGVDQNGVDQIIQTISSQSFTSEITNGMYIIDMTNSRSSTWPKDSSLSLFYPNVDPYNVDNWLEVMRSYIIDVKKLVANNIYLTGDSLNLAFIKKDSIYSLNCMYYLKKGITPFEVRIFGFDFSNKHIPLDIDNMKSTNEIINTMLQKGAEYAIWEELCPRCIVLQSKEHTLYKKLSERMINEYHNMN